MNNTNNSFFDIYRSNYVPNQNSTPSYRIPEEGEQNVNNNNNSLSRDQRDLLNIYVEQYNQLFLHIEHLHTSLDIIRQNMFILTNDINSNLTIPPLRRNNYTTPIYQEPTSRETSLLSRPPRRILTRTPQTTNINASTNTTTTPSVLSDSNILNSLFESFLTTPISSRPTQQQIDNAITVSDFGNLEHKTNNECPINLVRFLDTDRVGQIKHCKHTFLLVEINRWFANNVNCPVCRYDIRNYVPPLRATTNSENNDALNIENFQPSVSRNDFNINNEEEEKSGERSLVNETIINAVNEMLLNPNSFTRTNRTNLQQPNNTTYTYDPSNNLLFFETYIRYT